MHLLAAAFALLAQTVGQDPGATGALAALQGIMREMERRGVAGGLEPELFRVEGRKAKLVSDDRPPSPDPARCWIVEGYRTETKVEGVSGIMRSLTPK
ncbi:hypothetical protein EON82_14760 [bacterium]|nr:MAG: hypothetical protein EON82_14760 [bacterium]